MLPLRFVSCVLFVLGCGAPALAQSAGAGGVKENLDLPFDAIGENGDEEDAPEIVTFYGVQLEGDGFFYVIDRSGTMANGELQVAKREVIKNITEFTERVQFGVFFFDAGLMKFPSSGQPADANPAMKASAISFVSSTPNGGGTCPQAALLAALRMSQQASARRKVIVFLSDGHTACSGADGPQYKAATIAAVSAQNFQRAVVNTIGVVEIIDEEFLRSLAGSNGGTYTKVGK